MAHINTPSGREKMITSQGIPLNVKRTCFILGKMNESLTQQ